MSVLIFSQHFSERKAPLQNTTTINTKTLSSEKKNPRLILIREELITLTGDPRTAAILGQFLYWCQRVPDFDLYMEEEKKSSSNCKVFQHGWFNKTTQEFMEETMLCGSIMTFHRYLNFLVDRGWIQSRIDPHNKWDRSTQYRVNLRKLCGDLREHGYTPPGFAKAHFAEEKESDSGRSRS